METLRFYPEYQETIKEKVRKLIKGRETVEDNSKLEEIDVDSVVNAVPRAPTPRMVKTVMQLVSPDSRISHILSGSSRPSFSSITPMSPTTLTAKSSETTFHVTETKVCENPSLDTIEMFEKYEDSDNDDSQDCDR